MNKRLVSGMVTDHEAPEGKLFALYEEWWRLSEIAGNGDDDAAWDAVFDTERHFLETPAPTLAGLLFKLRYACLPESNDACNSKDGKPSPSPAVLAVLRDLEAMVGNAVVPHPVDHWPVEHNGRAI